jgi:molybdopterin/thiamine biosynthesis adenylyltransferase
MDDDAVEVGNLHRLMALDDSFIGDRKTDALARVLRDRHGATVDVRHERVSPDNALALMAGFSLIIEGTDNFASKFLIADAAMLAGVAVVHGAAVRWGGTVLTVRPAVDACYRCVFEDIPAGDALDCATAGIFGPITAAIGGLMAQQARDVLMGRDTSEHAMIEFDLLRGVCRGVPLRRRADCPLCGADRTILSIEADRYLQPEC